MDISDLHHSKKSDFCRTIARSIQSGDSEPFIFEVPTAFPNHVSTVYMARPCGRRTHGCPGDLMNPAYQTLKQSVKCNNVTVAQLHNVYYSKFYANSAEYVSKASQTMTTIFIHFAPDFIIQKTII